MHKYVILVLLIISGSGTHVVAQDGVDVRVGPGIEVDTRGDGVRIQVGPLRIRVGNRVAPADFQSAPRELTPREAHELISRFLSAYVLREAPVISEAGRPPGRIEDFVIDTRHGQVRYAAISYPDIDEGRKLFAIPLNVLELEWTPTELLWRADVKRATVAKAPGFDRDEWPEFADRRWSEEVDIYYGVVIHKGDLKNDFGSDPQPLDDAPALERLSVMQSLSVITAAGENLGQVGDMILDRESGQIRYVALQSARAGEQRALHNATVIPMSILKYTKDESDARFTTQDSGQHIAKAPRIRLSRALQPGHEDWAAGVDAWFGVTPDTRAVEPPFSQTERE